MRYAVLFPGQGSQFVGMGATVLAERPGLVEAADHVLGWSVARLCAEGPEEDLTATDKAQPALFLVSYALWEALAAEAPPPIAGAGHSLGEYTAYAAAGAVSFEDAIRLVARRGRAMADAAAARPSGMAAVIGADDETVEAVVAARRADGGALWTANHNAPGQVVVAGAGDDIAWLVEHGRGEGLRRVVPLKVAGAFHTPLMADAADGLREAIEATEITPPTFPVYANAAAEPVGDIPAGLVEQLTEPVRFAESLRAMAAAGVEAFVHVGPGDVTAGLAKRTVKDAEVFTVSELEDVAGVVESLSVA